MAIIWDSNKMATGVAAIDAEHQEWIRRFNEFEAEIAEGRGLDSVQKMLDFMVEYAEKHFVHEEMLIGEIDTPEAKLNRTEHNDFRRKTNEMREWIYQNGVSAVEVVSLRMDLEAWLVHHICFVDAKVWVTSKN